MKRFYSLRCQDCTLKIPVTEAALASMTAADMLGLLLSNDRNADYEEGDGRDCLQDGIRAMFKTDPTDTWVSELLPPSWERQ